MKPSISTVAAVGLTMQLFVVSAALPAPDARDRERLLQAVTVSQTSMNPTVGETVTLRVSLVHAARIDVQVLDRDGYMVRALSNAQGIRGENSILWDGRDDYGEIVPDEAWSFRVTANGDADEFFPAAAHATMLAIDPLSFSRVTATLRYKVPVPARVHVQAGTVAAGTAPTGEGPVLKTIVDREPRGAGFVAEHWNGFDASGSIYVPDLPGFAIAIAATPLPEQSVITFGNPKRPFLAYAAQRTGKSLLPRQSLGAHHAGLDVFHDIAPRLTVTPVSDRGRARDGAWTTADHALRCHLTADGPTARAFEQEPGKIFVFVDAHLVETRDAKDAAKPIDLRFPAAGEYRLAVNWRSEYGPVAVGVARVRVTPSTGRGTE